MNEPRSLPIHRSLNRPHLMMGAERSLVIFCGMITAIVMFSGFNLVSFVIGIVFWFGSFWGLVAMGKADTQMSQVYQRHVRYRSYYAARGCVHSYLAARPAAKR